MPICPECKLFISLDCPKVINEEENEELIVCESFIPEEPMDEEAKASLEEILGLLDAKGIVGSKVIRGKRKK